MAENVFVNKEHVWNTNFTFCQKIRKREQMRSETFILSEVILSLSPPNRPQKIWKTVLEWLWLRWRSLNVFKRNPQQQILLPERNPALELSGQVALGDLYTTTI